MIKWSMVFFSNSLFVAVLLIYYGDLLKKSLLPCKGTVKLATKVGI